VFRNLAGLEVAACWNYIRFIRNRDNLSDRTSHLNIALLLLWCRAESVNELIVMVCQMYLHSGFWIMDGGMWEGVCVRQQIVEVKSGCNAESSLTVS